MLIRTRKKPKNLPMRVCKEAVRWYGKYLLSRKTYNNIQIELAFHTENLCRDEHACTIWNDTNNRGRNFTIEIRPNLSWKMTLLTIAHEMIHVKQYAKGELYDYLHTFHKSKWKGKIVKDNGHPLDYWEQPWEIEAHGRERGLYLKFCDYMDRKYGK